MTYNDKASYGSLPPCTQIRMFEAYYIFFEHVYTCTCTCVCMCVHVCAFVFVCVRVYCIYVSQTCTRVLCIYSKNMRITPMCTCVCKSLTAPLACGSMRQNCECHVHSRNSRAQGCDAHVQAQWSRSLCTYKLALSLSRRLALLDEDASLEPCSLWVVQEYVYTYWCISYICMHTCFHVFFFFCHQYSFMKRKCLLWFSWWLCTTTPRRCDTDNNVEKVTKLVGLWIWSPWLWDDISKRPRFERDTLCGEGFQTYAKRSAVTMCSCWGDVFHVTHRVQPP